MAGILDELFIWYAVHSLNMSISPECSEHPFFPIHQFLFSERAQSLKKPPYKFALLLKEVCRHVKLRSMLENAVGSPEFVWGIVFLLLQEYEYGLLY